MLERLAPPAAAVAIAAVLVAGLAAPPAVAKNDPAKVKENREAVRKELKAKGFFVYFDLTYYVDVPKLKESRWACTDPPPVHEPTEKQGIEMFATLAGPDGKQWIRIEVHKWPQYEQQGKSRSVFQHEFKAWGQSVQVSDVNKICEGFYEDWRRTSSDVVEAQCVKPGKKQLGPAELYASAVATDAEAKVRQRRDWYVWANTSSAPACTWIAAVVFDWEVLSRQPALADKVADFMKFTKEIEDKRLK